MAVEEITTTEVADELNPLEEAEHVNAKSIEETKEVAEEEEVIKEWVDPGESEGESIPVIDEKKEEKTEEKKEHEPPPTHPRYKEIYKKGKDGDRKIAELEKKLEDALAKETVLPVVKEKVKEEALEPKGPDPIDAELDNLWKEHAEASMSLEGEKASKIYRKIHELDQKKLIAAVSIKDADIEKKVQEQSDARDIMSFEKRNPWFVQGGKDYDARKSTYAIAAETRLAATFKGSLVERLIEVEKEVEEVFGGAKAPPAKPPEIKKSFLPHVAGVNSFKNHQAHKEAINLTPEQKKVAQFAFDGDEEAYSNSLKKCQQGGN